MLLRCAFGSGLSLLSHWLLRFPPPGRWQRCQNHGQKTPFLLDASFHLPTIRQIFHDPFNNRVPKFSMSYLSPTELHDDLHFIPMLQKPPCVTQLKLIIVLLNPGPEFDLFDTDLPLFLFGLALFLGLLILVLAIVHDPADRRHGLCADLDKIEARFFAHGQSFGGWDHPDVFAVLADETDLSFPDPLVDSSGLSSALAVRVGSSSAPNSDVPLESLFVFGGPVPALAQSWRQLPGRTRARSHIYILRAESTVYSHTGQVLGHGQPSPRFGPDHLSWVLLDLNQ